MPEFPNINQIFFFMNGYYFWINIIIGGGLIFSLNNLSYIGYSFWLRKPWRTLRHPTARCTSSERLCTVLYIFAQTYYLFMIARNTQRHVLLNSCAQSKLWVASPLFPPTEAQKSVIWDVQSLAALCFIKLLFNYILLGRRIAYAILIPQILYNISLWIRLGEVA
jgi:hypothetical protein